MTKFQYDIFLSHSSHDKELIRGFAGALKEKGFNVWFDEWHIKVGEDISLKIEEALPLTKKLIFFISNNALKSEWATMERNTVLFRDPNNRERRFIPVKLDNCVVPENLNRFKYIDYIKKKDSFIEELIEALSDNDNINGILWLNNKDEVKTEKDKEFDEIIKSAKLLSQKADYFGANEVLNNVINNGKFDEKYIVNAKLQCAKNILLDDSLNTDEPLKLANECLGVLKKINFGNQLCDTLQLLGEIYRLNQDNEQAKLFFNASIENANSQKDLNIEAWCNLSLSYLHKQEKAPIDIQLSFVEKAYNLFFKLQLQTDKNEDAKFGIANCHLIKAVIFRGSQKFDESLIEYSKAIKIYEELGEKYEITKADLHLEVSEVNSILNEFEQSYKDNEKAVFIYKKYNLQIKEAKCYLNLAEMLDQRGQRVKSEELYKFALQTAQQAKSDKKVNWYYYRYAMKLIELQKLKEALEILGFLIYTETTTTSQKLDVLRLLSDMVKGMESNEAKLVVENTILHYTEELLPSITNPKEKLRLLMFKVHSLEGLKRTDEAMGVLERCLKISQSLKKDDFIYDYLNTKANLFHDLGDFDGEKATYYSLIEKTKNDEDGGSIQLLQTYTMLSQIELKLGNKGKAQELIDESRKLCKDYPFLHFVIEEIQTKINEK